MSITKPIPPLLLYLYILLLHLTISFASSNEATDGLINHVYTTHRPLSINLEDVLRLDLPSKVTSDSSSCDLQSPFFFQSASLTLKGSFSRGEKVFQHGDMYYVLRIDPAETKITLVSYKNIQDQVLEGEFIPEHKTYTFPSGSTGPELFEVQFKGSIALFSTVHDLVIIDFGAKTGPELIGVFDIHKSPIQAFGIVENYMYVAGENAIVAYNIQGIAKVDIRTMNTFYTFTLPDKQRYEVGVIQGICTCQDIWFFAEKNKIFAVKQDISIFSGRTIPVTKVISTEDDIVQIKRVGRSLVVLTAKEVIEYVFVKNCLDYTENLRIPSSVYEFDSHMAFNEARIYLGLKGSDKGRYFSVVNHQTKSVYIFEVAMMIQDSKQLLRPFYTHKSETNIDSIELHENHRDGVASLTLAVRINSEKAGVVILQRQPLSLMCSSWRAKNEIMNVQAKSRFCENEVYNYTKLMEEFKEEKRIPDPTKYQDPKGLCERSTTIAVNYEWKKGTGLFVCIIIVLALAVIAIVKVANKKKKKAKYGGHVRLHNEKKKKKSSPKHKIEIASFSYGGEIEGSKEGESSSPYNRKEKKKKKSTKKKATSAKQDS